MPALAGTDGATGPLTGSPATRCLEERVPLDAQAAEVIGAGSSATARTSSTVIAKWKPIASRTS